VVRQLLLGNLGQMGFKKQLAYAYPVERRSYTAMSRDELANIVVVIDAALVAKETLCSRPAVAAEIADDIKQRESIKRIAGFTDDEMKAFRTQAEELVAEHADTIRRVAKAFSQRGRLSGQQVN
jgi:hypothetical protein